MSKNDYTRFSNKPNKPAHNRVVEPAMETEDILVNLVEAPVQEIKFEEPKFEEPKKNIKGVVVNCTSLNVRKEPEPKAEILGTVDANCELIIDDTNSTEEFYKVCTAAGIEGYCVKYFITIVP